MKKNAILLMREKCRCVAAAVVLWPTLDRQWIIELLADVTSMNLRLDMQEGSD